MKIDRTKKVLCLFATTLLVASLMGCTAKITPGSSSENSTSTSSKEEAIKADLTLWAYPMADTNEQYYTDKGLELKKQQSGINLQVEMLPWDGGPNKVNIAIASGTTPDLLDDGDGRVYGYAGKGVLVYINDLTANLKGKVSQNILDTCSINGKSYMYPGSASGGYAWAVNRTLAEELGVYDLLPKDHQSWTYDDFKNFLKVTAEKGKGKGIYGAALFAGSQSSDTVTFSMLMSAGASVFNADYSNITLNTADAAKGLEFLSSLVKEGLVPPGAATMKDDDVDTLFYNSKIVIAVEQAFSTLADVESRLKAGTLKGPFVVELYEYPSFTGKPVRRASTGIGGMCIFKNDNDPMKINAAKAYMKNLFSDANIKEYVLQHKSLPAQTGVTVYEDNPVISAAVQSMIKWNDNTVSNWRNVTYWSEIRTVFYPEIQAAYSGTKTAKQALDDFAKNANAIVAKNKK